MRGVNVSNVFVSRWDWDRDCDTLDLAVGAPYMDTVSGDSDNYQSGVVFLITVDAFTGIFDKLKF